MWFMPYLRVRRAVIAYALLALGISLAGLALRFWPHVVANDHALHFPPVDLSAFLTGSIALMGGFATVLGLNLASENDGHLEVAWTKPVSREGYALGVFAVDIGAMVVCLLFTILCLVVVYDVMAGYPAVEVGSAPALLRHLAYCGFPLCVYAWIVALTASIKRNRGAVAGAFWPVMAVLGTIATLPIPMFRGVAGLIALVDPLVIYTNTSAQPGSITTYLWGWLVAVALLAVALVQWRRLEL